VTVSYIRAAKTLKNLKKNQPRRVSEANEGTPARAAFWLARSASAACGGWAGNIYDFSSDYADTSEGLTSPIAIHTHDDSARTNPFDRGE
jgi:hypothetical protein